MGYEFKDFGQTAVISPLSIRSIISGKTLEYLFTTTGFTFTTLTVSGRSNTAYDVEAVTTYGREGALQRSRRLNPRTIVIKGYAVATSNENYRKGMSRLNAHLYSKDIHTLNFTDDPIHTYYGTVVRVEDNGEESNRQIVEIEFVCNDPFKYTELLKVEVPNASPLEFKTDVPVIPDNIYIQFPDSGGASTFTLMNVTTKKKIVFKGNNHSNYVNINIKGDKITNSIAGTNMIGGLDIKASSFDSFKVSDGDVIWASPEPDILEIDYRGAKL